MYITNAMKQQFLEDGFVILNQVVPPDQTESVRASTDTVVARARAADPTWDTTPFPRTLIDKHCDRDTRTCFQLALHDNTMGVSAQLLDCSIDAIGVNMVSVLCNPEFEPEQPQPSGQPWGTDPRNWHRDVRPDHNGPLGELIADENANGPAHVQWNIALYDEAILNVIPGSHRRLNSEVESRQLNRKGGTTTPLDGSISVDLKVGDGVVYNNMLLHWGSKYTSREKRRTLHYAYRSFGNILPHQLGTTVSPHLYRLLDEPASGRLSRAFELYRSEYRLFEDIYRAVIAGDRARLQTGIGKLHPGPDGRLCCLIILTRLASDIEAQRQSADAGVDTSTAVIGPHHPPLSTVLKQELLTRLSTPEMDQLWERFERLDALLRSADATHVRGFLGKPTEYYFEELPADVTLERGICALMEQPVGAG